MCCATEIERGREREGGRKGEGEEEEEDEEEGERERERERERAGKLIIANVFVFHQVTELTSLVSLPFAGTWSQVAINNELIGGGSEKPSKLVVTMHATCSSKTGSCDER